MKNYKITVLRGDGIGPEIVNECIKVLDKAGEKFGFSFDYNDQLLGGCAIDATGVPYPAETAAACKASDAVLLGAVGGPKWDDQPGNNRPEKGLLAIREDLGLFANLRPAKIFAPLKSASPIKEEIIGDGLDILIVRELTGGIYFGDRGTYEENGVVGAYDTERYTYPEIKRIVKAGFEYAMKRDKRLTCVDKANVLDSSRLCALEGTRVIFLREPRKHPYNDHGQRIPFDFLYRHTRYGRKGRRNNVFNRKSF